MTAAMTFFLDNPMFYKDITQWLRNRTFTVLFFGLLAIAEVISLGFVLFSDGMTNAGLFMFYSLFLVLVVYGVTIGSRGKAQTRKEFQTRTYELIEMCGLRPYQVLNGKLFTWLYEFAFGFFCLVPFMFFAYLMGGVDFLEMICTTLYAWVLMIPIYLIQLVAASAFRNPVASIIGTLIMFILKLLFIFYVAVPMMFYSYFAIEWLTETAKKMMAGDLAAFGSAFGALMGYGVVIVILYFFSWAGFERKRTTEVVA